MQQVVPNGQNDQCKRFTRSTMKRTLILSLLAIFGIGRWTAPGSRDISGQKIQNGDWSTKGGLSLNLHALRRVASMQHTRHLEQHFPVFKSRFVYRLVVVYR